MLRKAELPADIAETLNQQDYVVIPQALTPTATAALRHDLLAWQTAGRLQPAAIGRGQNHQLASHYRGDQTAWLTGETAIQQDWLAAMESLRRALNERLLLGLDEYECHYACYPPGSFYRRHLDSFRGNNPRRVSTVLYLNERWQHGDGGLLQIYAADQLQCEVEPHPGTLVVFLSESVPHEVTEAYRERLSIAGWLRQRSPIS